MQIGYKFPCIIWSADAIYKCSADLFPTIGHRRALASECQMSTQLVSPASGYKKKKNGTP